MRLLILGGTWFLGRALAEEAVRRGLCVTTFNRGLSGPDTPGVRALRGDRSSPEAIRSLSACGPWDAVIDTSGYIPHTVLHGARSLHEAVDRYVFVSSAAAYRDWPERHVSDESAIRNCPPDATGSPHGSARPFAPQRYGELKAGCERAVRSVFGERSTMLRAGIFVGPYEYVGRLPWWLRRVQRGGTVLAPGDPNRQVQVTDVRDIAAFALDVAAGSQDASFNLTTPLDGSLTFARLLRACRLTTGSTASFAWVEDALLQRCGISPFTELPLWQPGPRAWTIAADRARAAGFSCRPIEETIHDTWTWMTTGDPAVAHPRHDEHGMEPAKEQQILTTWRLRTHLGPARRATRATKPKPAPTPATTAPHP
ncbi:NAD-dependent epimerase/dehydratase family protein [Embleya hyalina]|uniref:Reductase n=1 Tax=Embleya hyalina TaxID=516124 RepID=A0A401YEY1_9ACTN|nr:NAD-dependent epimerase/dehydratase family protein [Embleya hyalina]GCD93176.1 reductase [Embleya hyalina]